MRNDHWVVRAFVDGSEIPTSPLGPSYFYNQPDAEAKADRIVSENPGATCTVTRGYSVECDDPAASRRP